MRAKSLLRLALCVCAVTLIAPAPAAYAKKRSKKARVKRYKKRAFRAFAKGDYGKGIQQMRKAHKLLPHPGFLLNIAVAYDQWGDHCQQSLETFDAFFEACPDCKLRDKASVKQNEARGRCPALARIETTPPGAALSIDGERHGMTPQTLQLTPGPHEVRAERPGYETLEQRIEVRYGTDNHIALELAAIAPPPVVAAPPPPVRAPPPEEPTVTARLAPRVEPPTDLMPAVWSSFAVAAVGAGVGTAFTFQTLSALDDEEQARLEMRTKREVEEIRDDATTKAIVANIGFGAAAAGLVTGIVLLIVDGSQDEPEASTTRLTPVIGPGGVGVVSRF